MQAVLDYNVGYYEGSIVTELGEPHTRFHELYLNSSDREREQTLRKRKKTETKKDSRDDYAAGGF